MSTATALTISIGVVVVLTVAGGITLRQAWLAWRRYGAVRGLPLISSLSVEQIDDLPEEWPLPEKRWPIPRVPEIAADPVVAAAYARLARRSEQGLVYAAEVLTIVGGAWLGVNLLVIWRRLSQFQERVVAQLEQPDVLLMFSIYNTDLWLALLPIVPIIGAIALRAKANRYTDVRAIYELAAASGGGADPAPPPSLPQPVRDPRTRGRRRKHCRLVRLRWHISSARRRPQRPGRAGRARR